MRSRLRSALLFCLYKMQNRLSSTKIVELLWKFGRAEWGKWKGKWKSPLWNFIITRNSAFANAKREEFAEMLQMMENPKQYVTTG